MHPVFSCSFFHYSSFWFGKRCRMHTSKLSFLKDTTCMLYFLSLWVVGLIVGSIAILELPDHAFFWMRTAELPNCLRVSFLPVLLVPFFVCLVSVSLKRKWIIYIWSFYQSFLLVFISVFLILSFDSQGWLIRLLMMFPSVIGTSLFWGLAYYLLHHRNSEAG